MRTIIFLFLFGLCAGIKVQGQSSETAFTKSYVLEELSYGKIPEGLERAQISDMDLVAAQMQRLHLKLEETVFPDGHHTQQTTILNGSEEVFSQFPTVISRVFSDSTGISMYDAENKLWRFHPANAAYLEEYNDARADYLVSPPALWNTMPMPTAADLASLESEGYLIELLENDAIRISNSDEEELYEPAQMRYSSKSYVYGKLESERKVLFADLEGYGVVPVSEREVRYETRPSGMCMEKIIVRRYSAYEIETGYRDQPSATPSKIPDFQIWPIPANDVVFVQTPDNLVPATTISLVNASGVLMQEKSGVQPAASIHFDLRALPAGVYFLRAECTSGIQTHKLIKQ
ncbi:MAG: T9SS type A sorting domain-containing protein [Saprospiraceae bacterium]|nr:T9SS type A sorting domain-containing protein [Saprospiraceae bacterium]